MKTTLTLLACIVLNFSKAQTLENIQVNLSEVGSSEKVNLSLFHLNHVLFIKGFVVSDIYSTISHPEMAFISSTLREHISKGQRTQFIITTAQKVPYRLAVSVVKKDSQKFLVILTNYNPSSKKFEKKVKDDFYATSAEIVDQVVIGDMFELPLKNEKKFLAENDYLSLINMTLFNKVVDTTRINDWFLQAEKTQADKVNTTNWLKSYYYLSQYNYNESQKYLDALKTSVANSPEGERNQWAMFIRVLTSEIGIMKELDSWQSAP